MNAPTGRCPDCRAWLRYDDESGEDLPHRCGADDSEVENIRTLEKEGDPND